MTESASLPDYPRGITFEQVWAVLMKDREQMNERRADIDREMHERQERQAEFERERQKRRAEFEREMRENQAAFDRRIQETERILKEQGKEINNRIGSLTNLFGDFTLGMVVPKLREKFTDLGIIFLKSSPNVVIEDKKNNLCLEIDILLENGDKAMLVEVKTKLTTDRISKHVERLEKMRKYADLHGDKRVFVGAVAGFAITEEVRTSALSQGFYIIEPDGENFIITPPGNLKEW